jgi:hypothetical protein
MQFSKEDLTASVLHVIITEEVTVINEGVLCHRLCKNGGSVAKVARQQLEEKLGRTIISKAKASDYLLPSEEEKEVSEVRSNKNE